MNTEKNQLQAQLPDLQNQIQQLQQQNSVLSSQIAPLQADNAKLKEEVAYKEKRIQELKEPKAVMPSTLAQGVVGAQAPSYGSSSGFGTSPISTPAASPATTPAAAPAATPAATPVTDGASGRRVCVNCGAMGFAIKEVEDKSRIISYIPKVIYAKKNHCTKCGYEF